MQLIHNVIFFSSSRIRRIRLDGADTGSLYDSYSEITIFSPWSTPWVFNQIIWSTCWSIITNSQNTMIDLLSASLSNDTTGIISPCRSRSINTYTDRLLVDGSLELACAIFLHILVSSVSEFNFWTLVLAVTILSTTTSVRIGLFTFFTFCCSVFESVIH